MARKQRQFTAQFKLETVMEVLRGENPIAQICRERAVTDSLVYKWRGEFLEKAPGVFEGTITSKEASDGNERIAELERLVGQLAGSSPEEKRAMIQCLQAEASIQQLCQVFDCPRSTYYYQSMKRDEADVVAAMEAVLMRRPWFGYRRVAAQRRRDGVTVGETVVRRLLRQLAHTRSVGQVRVQTTDSNHPYTRYTNLMRGMKPQGPNQIWVADITYLRFGVRFLYLALILDAFTRAVRGWALSPSLSLDALKMALTKGAPLIFHSDLGSQYSAWLHTHLLDAAGVRLSLSDRGKPTQNGIAERFLRTLKDEHLAYADYPDFQDARHHIAHWLEVEYNTQRIHSALDSLTPAEFEMSARPSTSLS